MLSEKSVPDKQSTDGKSLLQRIGKSFSDSIGDIVFGMEDGTVSIFGLVFGVASSTSSSSAVLLAGATGAIAAAVSMMAGTFLDVESTNDQAKVQLAQVQTEIEINLDGCSSPTCLRQPFLLFLSHSSLWGSRAWSRASSRPCSCSYLVWDGAS